MKIIKKFIEKLKNFKKRRIVSQKPYKIGEELFTVQKSSKVIPFVVDKITKKTGKNIGKYYEYECNWRKHNHPKSNHGWKFRLRQSHNLFTNIEDAQKYLQILIAGKNGGRYE